MLATQPSWALIKQIASALFFQPPLSLCVRPLWSLSTLWPCLCRAAWHHCLLHLGFPIPKQHRTCWDPPSPNNTEHAAYPPQAYPRHSEPPTLCTCTSMTVSHRYQVPLQEQLRLGATWMQAVCSGQRCLHCQESGLVSCTAATRSGRGLAGPQPEGQAIGAGAVMPAPIALAAAQVQFCGGGGGVGGAAGTGVVHDAVFGCLCS